MLTATDHQIACPQSLNDTALDAIAGGLNPQPLPPRYGGHSGFKSPVNNALTARSIIIVGG